LRAPDRHVLYPCSALSFRAIRPAHPGPMARGVGGALRTRSVAEWARRSAVRSLSSESDPPVGFRNTLEGAEFEEVERPTAIQIYVPIRTRWPKRRFHYGTLPARVYRHQFGCRSRGASTGRRIRVPRGPRPRPADHRAVIGATHLPVTVKTRARLERRHTRPGRHRTPIEGRRPRAFSSTPAPPPQRRMFSGKASGDEIDRGVVRGVEINR